MEKFNKEIMDLKDYRLFIYDEINGKENVKSTIRKEYWNQIIDNSNWTALNKKIYDDINDKGWFDEFIENDMFIAIDNFLMKKIEISEKHKAGIIKFDDVEINYFIRFELEIKNRFPVIMLLYSGLSHSCMKSLACSGSSRYASRTAILMIFLILMVFRFWSALRSAVTFSRRIICSISDSANDASCSWIDIAPFATS